MVSNGSHLSYSNRVNQASGMVTVQAECTFAQAIMLMKARAVQTRCTLDEVALAVLDRTTRFGT